MVEGGGKWDNCNGIINKYILKKDRKEVSVVLRILKTEYFLFDLTRHFWFIEVENI